MSYLSVQIPISNVDEALHLQNVAALNIAKYRDNQVEGLEACQSNLIRIWHDVHSQAGAALTKFSSEIEE
ncbi:hypothetical protein ACBZ91_21620 [Vibrio natriegens]|uniref:hypothetical protein n=1 Tax=Vibrio TaxID=662 RepID=UPI000E47BB06|nr:MULTISPECIES: hypothetical protein [unclassified Vibrio]AXT73050.1 hypothetical protein DBX26_19035 [Vibrio sp. dhg]MDV6252838.1 hypothetical protein [Vibrio sp. EA2]